VLLYAPLTKVFYSNMVYTFLNLLDLISLLCLRYLCRCPLANNLWSVGILPSSVVKLLPFDHPYSLGIDMVVPLDYSILLFQIVTSKNSVSSLNILVYMSMTFLSSEIPLYSVVKSLSFVFFLFPCLGMLVSLESCVPSYFSSMLTFIPQ
jgi:hypothetical protein